MTIAEYRLHTTRTLPDLGIDLKELSLTLNTWTVDSRQWNLIEIAKNISDKLNYTHMTSGLAGELGELVQCIGTEMKINSKVDKINLGEEIGDIYWYLANYANMRDLDIPEDPKIDITEPECVDFLIIRVADLVDVVKRFMAYNKPIERRLEAEAVYDIRVALLMLEKTYELSGEDIRAKNIAKLKKRFPEKFSDTLAVNRNLEEERKTLE
jgi:NTP pyrophosphatase (non-canonical NTP hydrolase)